MKIILYIVITKRIMKNLSCTFGQSQDEVLESKYQSNSLITLWLKLNGDLMCCLNTVYEKSRLVKEINDLTQDYSDFKRFNYGSSYVKTSTDKLKILAFVLSIFPDTESYVHIRCN